MFKRKMISLLTLATLSSFSMASLAATHVLLTTSAGNIELELDEKKAPITVDNFLGYVKSGFYNNTVFHRVIPGFMIQGGGFTTDLQQKQTNAPIKNEADNGLKNSRGTIAMARTTEPESATSQFFINVEDNAFLNHDQRDFGYAVFGKVTQGLDIVEQISQVPTQNKGPYQNVPVKPITLLSTKVLP